MKPLEQMTVEELRARISELDEVVSSASGERSDLKQRLAELSTPFKVGDRVMHDKSGRVWEISAIKPGIVKLRAELAAKETKE